MSISIKHRARIVSENIAYDKNKRAEMLQGLKDIEVQR